MEPEKDFSIWMPVKGQIHNKCDRPFYHEREVWWCAIGLNVGFETDGKGISYTRPVLIIKDFNHATFWCLPVTTQIKKSTHRIDIDLNDKILRQVVLSQLRTLDAKRLRRKIGTLEKKTFYEIKTAIAMFLTR